ncbi:class I SAM-dependent methyltransferase [Aquabacter spiritensis]|uniref:Phosphatidylethanolamine/phosphatidyl-N-methylethanolamine N-methyltransferase n=1 Tax=Aquabacter spiritensis TaxID=933073 RepID=A0A4R3LWV7_9HYPH|nr:rRNA adenine N-6-methyltransferase family protein [Aquabacter spiritensis]TCT05114.1 phosphatidylethanolamine/phosphatidyl-N-methylethanolamine N-methyltransferase [Aquabacter spiritensis]
MLQSPGRRGVPHKPRLNDEIRFLQSWFQNPLKTGAVSPSGRALARLMAGYLDPNQDGPVIELGPGTGPVTKALLNRGFAPERLFLIEYNREFCGLLRRRYPGVTVIQGDAYEMRRTLKDQLPGPAVGTISSLPLFTRSPQDRERMVNEAFDLCIPSAPFVQFTYAVVSPVPLKHGEIHGERSPRVWWNLPPARVWAYRRP